MAPVKAAQAIVAAAVGALVLAGAAAASEPTQKHTKAGTAAAKATLLQAGDLGSGWTAKNAGASSPTFTCRGYAPKLSDIVETGSATSPDFSAGGAGPFIVQETGVYASPAQAAALWRRAVKPGLAKCAEQTLETVSAQGIKVTNGKSGVLPIAKVVPHTAGYRVVATLKSKTQSLKTYFDVIVISHGATVAEVTLSSFVHPVPAKVENALATLVARRMGASPA
jgi:hypothetical protein